MKHWLIVFLTWLCMVACSSTAGELTGVVLGPDGDPVPRATIVLCDQDTGIPVSRHTFKPFVEGRLDLKGIAVVTTDAVGRMAVMSRRRS